MLKLLVPDSTIDCSNARENQKNNKGREQNCQSSNHPRKPSLFFNHFFHKFFEIVATVKVHDVLMRGANGHITQEGQTYQQREIFPKKRDKHCTSQKAKSDKMLIS